MKRQFNIEIIHAAKLEIADAYEWYEDQQTGLGELFLKSLRLAIDSIHKSPRGFTLINSYHRQIPLNNFPFVVLYEINKNTLYIDAVFHTSRES